MNKNQPDAKIAKSVKHTKSKPASYLFWKIQSELSKTERQLAKIQEALDAIEEKVEHNKS